MDGIEDKMKACAQFLGAAVESGWLTVRTNCGLAHSLSVLQMSTDGWQRETKYRIVRASLPGIESLFIFVVCDGSM